MVWAEIGTMLAIMGFVYAALRNFKADIKDSIAGLGKRMDLQENRITSLEERMFYMATGKTLAEAMLLEKMRRVESKGE